LWGNDGDADDDDVGVAFGVTTFSFVVVVIVSDEGWQTVFLSRATLVFRRP